MDDFAQNARPSPQGVRDSLLVVRKAQTPFAHSVLESRLDLLMLPFLHGLPTLEQRVERLRIALDFVAGDLTAEQQIVYRHVFQEPEHTGIGKREEDAAAEINDKRRAKIGKEISDARQIEKSVLDVIARQLVSPDFEAQLDDRHPIAREAPVVLADAPADAHELLTYHWEMDLSDEDPRKIKEYRRLTCRMTVPHQRVFGLRYFNDRSPAIPIDDGVTMLSSGHTYLGTFKDALPGGPPWWMHFIHLGKPKALGEEFVVETRERYFDAGEGEDAPYISQIARYRAFQSVTLGLRLPLNRLEETTPEIRLARNPLDQSRQEFGKRPLRFDADGWVRHEFTDLEFGVQYGIYLPGFRLYKT